MSKKRNIEAEKMLRRIDARKKRLDRVISGYLYHMHPDIYAEGLKFYNTLDSIYPHKKDLRKTAQFLSLQYRKPEGKTTKVQHVREKTVKDTFVLEIPLEKRKTAVRQTTSTVTRVAETADTSTSASAPKETADISMATNATEKSVDTIVLAEKPTTNATGTADLLPLDDATLEQIIQEKPTTNATGTADLLPLDDATLEQIIQELKTDTNLYEFFNHMDFEMNEVDDDILLN